MKLQIIKIVDIWNCYSKLFQKPSENPESGYWESLYFHIRLETDLKLFRLEFYISSVSPVLTHILRIRSWKGRYKVIYMNMMKSLSSNATPMINQACLYMHVKHILRSKEEFGSIVLYMFSKHFRMYFMCMYLFCLQNGITQ